MPDSKSTPRQAPGDKPSNQPQSESTTSQQQPPAGKVIRDWASI